MVAFFIFREMEVARFEGIRCENHGDSGKDDYGTG